MITSIDEDSVFEDLRSVYIGNLFGVGLSGEASLFENVSQAHRSWSARAGDLEAGCLSATVSIVFCFTAQGWTP